ncbi:MAG: hypothetical protein NC320_01450 [Clostridium sp.]|nr:hypothetical protein [Clostridium sp.]MCM1547604.1 hypothetical protein [Ruminococcus sp.]
MDERKTYRSSPIIFLKAFIAGLIFGFFLRIPYRIVTRNVFYLPYKWEIPLCTVLGLILGAVFLLCTYTSVYIDDREVTVKKHFRKYTYSIEAHLSIGEKNINIQGVSLERRWLIIKPLSKEKKSSYRHRLNSFTDSACENIINQLNLYHWQDMSAEVKNVITENSWYGGEHFEFDAKNIIKREWKNVRTNSLMVLGITAAILIAVYFSNKYDVRVYKYVAYAIAAVVCLINIPFEIIRTKRNAERCLYELSFKGDHLMINDDHYMIPDIQLLTVTHKNIKSNSLYPVQRYIVVKDSNRTHKYWAGSESSVSDTDYGRAVSILVSAFVNYPEKIKHIIKRPLLSK